eukprot:scaffold2501_cov113-Isochrysis_galbana.AAC.2
MRRYVGNAITNEARRTIPASNPMCVALRQSKVGAALLEAAGFRLSGDALVASNLAMLFQVQGALEPALQSRLDTVGATALLFALPEELLVRTLAQLPTRSLFSLRRVCRAAAAVTAQSRVWRARCPVGLRRQRLEDGEAVGWWRLCQLSAIWDRLERSLSREAQLSLRQGAPLASLAALPAELRLRLPPHVLASLACHDGQRGSAGAAGLHEPGLFFLGARLLSLSELAHEAARAPAAGIGGDGLLPLTTREGFQHVAVSDDGAVVLVSGFNAHVKAPSWAHFLERILRTTV